MGRDEQRQRLPIPVSSDPPEGPARYFQRQGMGMEGATLNGASAGSSASVFRGAAVFVEFLPEDLEEIVIV